jgi:glycerophosphoryl diester phosphodiesterase
MDPRRALLTSFACLCMIAAMPAAAQVIVAHRGASHDAPENTLAAFRLAFEQGADGAEGDFYLSKDGQIVCIHDASTKRTGDRDLKVAQSTLAELRAADVGRWKGERFAGERIATLAEVLAIVPAGKMFYIEVKCGPEVLPEMKRVIQASGLKAGQLRVISFNAKVVAESKKLLPQVKAHWITGFKRDQKTGEWTPSVEKVFATLKETRADGLNAERVMEVWTPELVAKVKGMGLETAAWTVDDVKVARALVRAGVWGLTTNRPAHLRQGLRE